MSRISVAAAVACSLLGVCLLSGCKPVESDALVDKLEKKSPEGGAAGALQEMENQTHRQAETIRTIRNVGFALVAWVTDQVGAAAAGAGETVSIQLDDTRFTYHDPIPASRISELLVPTYLKEVPERDGWGHELQYFLSTTDITGDSFALVRSPGANGTFEGDEYVAGKFPPDAFEQDLVWADGIFMRWPEAR